MIHHASIPVEDPETAARVIAELWRGRSMEFPPFEGCYIAFADDNRGSAIETYPRDRAIVPGDGMLALEPADRAPEIATHLCIASPLSVHEILGVADRAGWQAYVSPRGPFDLVEFWLENTVLLEVLSPSMHEQYIGWMSSSNWAEVHGLE
jgi:hypothetical protein